MAEIEQTFIRLPPDSTGKRSGASARLVIDYESEADPLFFNQGQTIVGQTSAATAEIVGVNRVDFPAGKGQVYLDTDEVVGAFVRGENIQVTGLTYASITTDANLYSVYYQKNILVDKNNPNRSVAIDQAGSINTSFNAGSPFVSTFSEIYTAQRYPIKQYVHAYDSLSDEFYDETSGSGSISYNNNQRSVTLDTGSTTSGSLARRTSHFYTPCQPGNNVDIEMSILIGDVGKTNCIRRWGYYDDNNGLFWELNGTQLNVVVRSSSDGTVQETRIPQSSFNSNKIDGSDRYGFNVDVSKANIYFIDLQGLGVGVVRFGLYNSSGEKIICHEVRNPNRNTSPYMGTATLPIKFECFNDGGTASSSELKVICATIFNIGPIKRKLKNYSKSLSSRKPLTYSDGEVPIISIRAATGVNGYENKMVTILNDMCNQNAGDGLLLLRMRRGCILAGDSWAEVLPTKSAAEYDISATGISITGVEVMNTLCNAAGNVETYDFPLSRENISEEIDSIVFADGTTTIPLTLTAQVIDNGTSGNLMSTISWKESWL